MGQYDAVPVPMMSRADAVRLLLTHFPQLSHLFSDPDNLDEEVPEPYHSYKELAREVLKRKDNKELLEDVAAFMNEIVSRRERVLEPLAAEMFEELVTDPWLLQALRPNLSPEVQDQLDAEEREYRRLNPSGTGTEP